MLFSYERQTGLPHLPKVRTARSDRAILEQAPSRRGFGFDGHNSSPHSAARRHGRVRRGLPRGSPVGFGPLHRPWPSRSWFAALRQAPCARASGSSRLLLTSCRTIGLGFCELIFLDGRISARLAPDHLRRLAVGAEKGTSHLVAIPESGQLRDNVKGVVGVFQ